MLKAKFIFALGCALIQLSFCQTSQLQAQTPEVVNLILSDSTLGNTGSYTTPSLPVAAPANHGCQYGTCASSGYQTNSPCTNCQQYNVASCSGCGVSNRIQWEPFWVKDLDYFQYPPAPSCPGDRLHQLMGVQQANGRMAQLAFYNFHFNFHPGSQQWSLSPAGVNNVHKIARIWALTPGSIVVEPTSNPTFDQMRVQIVQHWLAKSGIQSDVVTGKTPSVGLSGVEAINIYQQRLLSRPQTASSAPTQSSPSAGN